MKPIYSQQSFAPPHSQGHTGIYFAAKIATRYAHRLPTPDELMRDFHMSRATAYRYIGALRWAREEVAAA